FHARSFLYDDEAIRGRAVARLTAHFDSRRELKQIARLATDIFWKGSTAPLPSWRLASAGWAPPSPTPFTLKTAMFAVGDVGPEARAYAATLDRAGKALDLEAVKAALGPVSS